MKCALERKGSNPTLFQLTVTGDESSVGCAVREQFAAFWWGLARGSLHEEVVFVKGALSSGAIQWLAFLLERAPGLLSVRLTFAAAAAAAVAAAAEERRAVFGVAAAWERPERVAGLLIPSLSRGRAIIRIHGCHVAV